MREVLQFVSWGIGGLLEILVLGALVRGPYKRFPLVFAYCLTLFLTTVTEVAAFANPRLFVSLYWVNDVILQVLVFCVVISLIYQATEKARNRVRMRNILIGGALLISAVSFLTHRDPSALTSRWMTEVSRDLSFCAVILDLVLWSVLIAAKRKDRRVLLLTSALGIQFTGAAIGQSLRHIATARLSRPVVFLGSLTEVASHLLCLYVWWQAFRTQPAAKR